MPRTVNLDVVLDSPWAILPRALSAIEAWVRDPRSEVGFQAATGVPREPAPGASSAIAVIPVHGVIEHRESWIMQYLGGVSAEGIRESIRTALGDPAVSAIILDVDSPGGTVAGITELAAEIRASRGSKPIVAVANTLAASAAYWIAAQADELVASPSASVGSIGVYAIHQEASRMLDEMGITTTIISAGPHKTEGNEFEPLTDDAKAALQRRVDESYQSFLSDVAAGRGLTAAQVEDKYGGGQVLSSKRALAAGMVDRVETLGQAIARLSTPAGRRRAMKAGDEGPEMLAGGPAERTESDLDPADMEEDRAPFTARLAALAEEAADLATAAEHRARSRAAAGRPAFSSSTEEALRASRDAITALLDPGGPEPVVAAPEDPGGPEPKASTPPLAVHVPSRFRSREDWLRHLEARTH